MNSAEVISHIPADLQQAPWLQAIIGLLQEQTQQIKAQTKLIQEQAEQIITLKQTVQDLKGEISRLNKTPKRPKFRPGGGDPKSRSGKPGNSTDSGGTNSANKLAPEKVQHSHERV